MSPSSRPPVMPRALTFLRAHEPTTSFYRYLYDTVGQPWLWFERRLFDDVALAPIIRDPKIGVYVLYYGGVPAGFAEIDARPEGSKPKDCTLLAYFGLVPDFIGRGLGRFFLNATIESAWQTFPAGRLIVAEGDFFGTGKLPTSVVGDFIMPHSWSVAVPKLEPV